MPNGKYEQTLLVCKELLEEKLAELDARLHNVRFMDLRNEKIVTDKIKEEAKQRRYQLQNVLILLEEEA